MSHLDATALIGRGFKVGSIVRLKMKNFLTYDECEVLPGPKLNMVIGPNGTGKSALTHAICLACCGSTGDVGRSADLSKFVKRGTEGLESYVEVDILTEERSIATIRRVINSDNKGSKWFLNGKLTKQADIKAMVSRLSIDVENLCTFMPQDKVGDFSRYTPKQMLSNTLRSIHLSSQELNLSDEQHALSEIQDTKEDFRRKRDATQVTLNINKHKRDSMKLEMDRMQRREEKQQLLRDYEVRLLAVEIGELDEKRQGKQIIVDQKTNLLQEETLRISPLEARERDLKQQQEAREKAAADAQDLQRKIDDSLRAKKDALEQRGVEVDSASNLLVSLYGARAGKEQQLRAAQRELEEAQRAYDLSKADIPQLDMRAAEVKAELEKLNNHKEKIDDETLANQELVSQFREEITASQEEANSLQDSRQIYRDNLAKSNDAHSRQVLIAMNWLDNNQEDLLRTGRLRSEVFGPVARYCTVADPACAVMLEKAIPANKFMGFVVDNDADAEFLKHELRIKQKLSIDVYTMKRVNVDVPRIYPERLIRELNLTGYLCDQLVCPDIIRALFYSFHNLHKVLWGRGADNVTAEQQMRLCQQDRSGFKLYIHETTGAAASSSSRNSSGGGGQQQALSIIEYKGKFSRDPSAPPSTSSVGVTGRGVLRGGGDEDIAERRAALQRKIAEANTKLKQAKSDLDVNHAQLSDVGKRIQTFKSELADVRSRQSAPAHLKNLVDIVQRKITAFQRELSTGAEEERARLLAGYEQAIKKVFDTAQEVVKLVQRSNAQKVERMVTAMLRGELQDALRDVTAELDQARRGVRELTKELASAEKERDGIKQLFDAKEADLNHLISQTGKTPAQYARENYTLIREHCPEETSEAIRERMGQLEDEINRIADNPQLQHRFEEVTKEVARLEGELARAAEEFSNAEESLHKRSQRWLVRVREIVEKLDTKFGWFMSDLQLGGEVKLREIGKFNDYELQLFVKFRDNSKLAAFDGNMHSGGERAVCTVMFLMALQSMTTSPFRVVDEINQGMDESNERMVFDRIIKSCCGDASKPQFFLVTPKLLQGLMSMHNEDVTVLLIWNGPGTVKKWTFREILSNLSQTQGRPLSQHSQSQLQSLYQQSPAGVRVGAASSSSAQAPAPKMRRTSADAAGVAAASSTAYSKASDPVARSSALVPTNSSGITRDVHLPQSEVMRMVDQMTERHANPTPNIYAQAGSNSNDSFNDSYGRNGTGPLKRQRNVWDSDQEDDDNTEEE